jgi:hypothetical protein
MWHGEMNAYVGNFIIFLFQCGNPEHPDQQEEEHQERADDQQATPDCKREVSRWIGYPRAFVVFSDLSDKPCPNEKGGDTDDDTLDWNLQASEVTSIYSYNSKGTKDGSSDGVQPE